MARPWRTPCLVCGRPTANGPRCKLHGREVADPRSTTERGLGSGWQRIAKAAIARQPWCSDCGLPALPGDPLTGEHIVPRSEGGTSDPGNVTVLHRSCNTKRSNRRRAQLRRAARGATP